MNQEPQQPTYRGVKCLHCAAPIPIPAQVASIEAEFLDQEIRPLSHGRCQVFALRCMACGKEKPYKVDEIFEFAAAPNTVMPRTTMASSELLLSRVKAKAANG